MSNLLVGVAESKHSSAQTLQRGMSCCFDIMACSTGDADMEDMLGGAGPAKAPAAGSEQQEGEEGGIVLAGASSRRGKENVAPNKGAGTGAQQQQQQAAPAGPKPDMGESYTAWVTYQKNRWRQVSEQGGGWVSGGRVVEPHLG
jgi:hypothetical protein